MKAGHVPYTKAEGARLLGGESGACAFGLIVWKPINGQWRGSVTVACDGFEEDELVMEMMVRPRRPSEPTVIMSVRNEILVRVDVNGGHKGERFTHKQWRAGPFEAECTQAVPNWFYSPPFGDSVPTNANERVFASAARLFGVDTSSLDWTDAPEGGVPR